RLGQFAVAEDLEAVLAVLDRARREQLVEIDVGQAEVLEVADVDQRVLDAEGVGEPALGDAPLDGHLPALEADEVHVAGAGLLALAAAAGGLAGARRLATADALLLFDASATGRGQLAQLVHFTSPRSLPAARSGISPLHSLNCNSAPRRHQVTKIF